MSKKTDMYIHQHSHWMEITSNPERKQWNYTNNKYDVFPGLRFDNHPFRYRMEFYSLSSRYDAVIVKLLTAPAKELIGVTVALDGDVFEDLLKHGNLNFLGNSVELEETLVFKHRGTMKLCRQ